MKASPLSLAKKRFGIDEKDPTKARKAAKEKLVAAVQKLADGGLWIDRVNDEKGLESVSNKKLLRLLDTLEAVKAEHGTREKLIDALIELAGGRKDGGFRDRFESWSTPRLWDRYVADKKNAN
ncbi:MAG: hypothetical protein AAGE52_29045 [Myxococcota bacterium]